MKALRDRLARLEAAHAGPAIPYTDLSAEIAHAMRARPPDAELDQFLADVVRRVEAGAETADDALVLAGCSLGTLRTMHGIAARV